MSARKLTSLALLAVLTYVGGLIRIPLGPIPLTLQTLFVILTGLLLDPESAFFSLLLHLLLKLVLEGPAVLVSPSFGFVIGFIPAASLLSYLARRFGNDGGRPLIQVLAATCLLYGFGLPYMYMVLKYSAGSQVAWDQVFLSGLLVFLPGDALKGALAVILSRRLQAFVIR